MSASLQPKNPIYTDYGGLLPKGSLWGGRGIFELHEDVLILRREGIWQRVYVLPRVSIVRLSAEKPFWLMFSGRLRIQHTVESYPALLFWSRDIEALTVLLQQHGFPVSMPDS